MKSNHILKLRAGTALQALALIGAGVGTVAFAAPAAAQDYTSGAVSGTVTNETGEAVAGATVTVTSRGQGFTRTATTSSSGAFRFGGLTPGSYDVAVTADGVPGYRAEGVNVLASQTASLNIALGGEEIVVTGAAAASSTGGSVTGLTVDLSEFVKTNPINRDLTSVVLLAPGTSLGDDGFGNLASIGGSSVAENAYYINGLNTTNFDNYLGSARVPFEFYRSVEVKSGGYSAEFGRATGGIINAVSKSGSNDFTAGIHLNYEPDAFRSNSKNLQTCALRTATSPVTDVYCNNNTNRAFDRTKNYSAIIEAGGPIIRDRLFFYGLAEFRRAETLRVSRTGGSATEQMSNDPFYAFKIDAYPIDGHHLEFTGFDTRQKTIQTVYSYLEGGAAPIATGANGAGVGSPSLGSSLNQAHIQAGGFNFVGQYTGTFADWLTVSGAYGRVRDNFQSVGIDAGSSGYVFQNATGSTTPVSGVTTGGFYTAQRTASRSFPYTTEREFYRGDVDLFFNAFGDHHIRAGFDVENNTLQRVTVRNGGAALVAAGFLRPAAFNANFGGAGASLSLPNGTSGIVEVNYFNSGGAFDAQNKAFYITDEWKLGDRLTVNLGVRRDDFKLSKPGGIPYITLKENYAPRIAASYDLWEGETGRIFGSFGRYFLPIASNTAFRQASPELYVREQFTYTGIANGLPTGLVQLASADFSARCPAQIAQGLTPFSTGVNCAVTGDGTVKDTTESLSTNLKATRETEWIVGYEHEFGDVTLGLNYTHRNMDVSAEDVAVDKAVNAYCTANGIAGCAITWTGYHQYVIVNPGSSATFNLAGADGRQVTLTPAQLGYPNAIRKYDAVEFTFNRKWDGKWSLNGSYTWSKSEGNSEGFVQSDFEQADAGITQDFDQPEFANGAYGRLPNDRTHRFKFQGAYALTDDFTIGTSVRVESERPLSCFGWDPSARAGNPNPYTSFANGYTNASHFCSNRSTPTAYTVPGVNFGRIYYPTSNSVSSPRGTASKTDWFSTIDLSARYNVTFGDQAITFRADVFNLLNSQAVMGRNEIGDGALFPAGTRLGVTANPNYNNPTSYQAPRYVRLGVDIAF